MAVTLTSDNEITYVNFPIEKLETDQNGDVIVYGKASDGGLDSDHQIVDPQWMGKAVQEWLSTGANLRVQHNAQRDPAGIGLSADTDSSGATFVKGLVCEPVAKTLVTRGALRAYSVGIARPTIVRDAMAPGGRITGGELVEISLVDRPANKRCGIQLVKSANGHAEYVGKMFGSDADITKALGIDGDARVESALNGLRDAVDDAVRAQNADPDRLSDPADSAVSNTLDGISAMTDQAIRQQAADKAFAGKADMSWEMPDDMSFTFTPNDLAKILKSKFIEQHYEELAFKALTDAEELVYKRNVSTAERRSLAGSGHALSDGSYPIANSEDLHNAAILARSGHGNVSGAKALIARRARELGVANPLDDNNDAKKSEDVQPEITAVKAEPEVAVEKEAEPVITKEPEDAVPAKGKKPKKGKKLPPWLNQAAKADAPAMDGKDDESGGDDDGDDDTTCKMQHEHTVKCMPSGTPQSASGAKDAPAMDEMPNPNAYQHSPMPAGRATPEHKGYGASPETAAMLRFKSIGIDTDMGRLHDLTCAAFHPDEVAKYHPFASIKNVIDTGMWQRKAVDAACGPIENAMLMTQIWQAAETLKGADEADLNDYRLELHKAFRDANPGPTSYPTPGMVTPGQYKRPVITGGHAANSPGYDGPNSSPSVASGPVHAQSFDRPPLSSGHQSPSPSFMKGGDGQYPLVQGAPTVITYAFEEKMKARRALSAMHDHLAHVFPQSCPMLDQDPYRVEQRPAVPPVAGIGKDAEPAAVKTVTPDAVFKAPVGDEVDDMIFKAFKKARKKLGKKVLAGKMTVDEARAKLGRNFSQKDAEAETVKSEQPAAAPAEVTVKSLDPDVIKSAMTEAITPLLEKISAQDAALKAQGEQLAAQQAIVTKMADMPDPMSAAFTGLAVNPVRKAARPAGVPSTAEVAERTQQMIMRQLDRTWRTSENPAEREAARSALDKFQGVI